MSRKKTEDGEDFVELDNLDEILGYFDESEIKQKKEKRPDLDTFSAITFLENDGKRLSKLNALLQDKLSGHAAHSQTKRLLDEQIKHNDILEAELVQRMLHPRSNLNMELSKLWNQIKKIN